MRMGFGMDVTQCPKGLIFDHALVAKPAGRLIALDTMCFGHHIPRHQCNYRNVPARPTDLLPGQGRIKNLNDDYAKLCAALNLPYRSSHAFRHGHILFCVARCETPADFLAVSQNVMHADVKMTAHYGAQDLRAIHGVYANLISKHQHTQGGGVQIDIEAAVTALTAATKSDQIPAEQRDLLRKLGIEIFSRLTR